MPVIPWKMKAAVMRICDGLPLGDRLYVMIQRRFGRLNADPMLRLSTQATMAQWILGEKMTILGRRFFEVGTGHKPMVPIGFFLCGAASVVTVDLNRRLDWGLTSQALAKIAANRQKISQMYSGLADPIQLELRLDLVERLANKPVQFLDEAGITYLAPLDAANTNLPSDSFDFHFSVTTLEHISPGMLEQIFCEARRLVANDGLVIHFIDPSDHFQHQDNRISRIHFLKYSDEAWMRIAGNQFAYCNRLRASDYVQIVRKAFPKVIRMEVGVDEEALLNVQAGFEVDGQFSQYEVRDLCSTQVNIMASL